MDLFGEDVPDPIPKVRKSAQPKPERKPTAKQLRLMAPEPKVLEKVEDDESRALKALHESGMLAPSDQERCRAAIRDHQPSETAIKMAEWRRRNGNRR